MTTLHPLLTPIESADISSISKSQYIRNAGILLKMSGQSSLEYVLGHPAAMLQKIRTKYPNSQSSKAVVAAVKAIFKYTPELRTRFSNAFDAWHEASRTLDRSITARTATAEPTQREMNNWVPWPEVLEKQRGVAATAYGSNDHLVLSMYTLIEPARADYGAVKLYRSPPPASEVSANHMVLSDTGSYLVLAEYKTSKKYGSHRRDIPEELARVIDASVRAHPRAYLFVNASEQPYTTKNSFTKFVNRILERLFGRKITISLLRHAFISALDFNAKTPAELFHHARNMMHSIGQQQMYRRHIPGAPAQSTQSTQPTPRPAEPAPIESHAHVPAPAPTPPSPSPSKSKHARNRKTSRPSASSATRERYMYIDM